GDRLRCRPDHHLSIPSVPAVARSDPASPRTDACSNVLPPAVASSNAHVLPAVLRSSPAVAASWSGTSSQSLSATPAAATGFPGCRPTGSAPAALGSSENDDKRAGSSLLPGSPP